MSCTATWLCRHSAKTLRQNSTLSRKASGIGKASAAASSSAAAVWEAGAGSTDARTGVAARPASNNHAPADTTCIPRLFITILLSELAPLFAPSHVRSRPRPSTALTQPSSRHSHEMPPRKHPTQKETEQPRKAPRPRLPRLSHPRPRCPPNPAGGGKPPPPPSSFRLLCFILRAF